ncbi:MAG: DUF2029 domain-containing protein, partial [Alphaproteobacteria bacterium]|nr:DUF2029 domain-containing protein [Alphaproteobacteria bacterium]
MVHIRPGCVALAIGILTALAVSPHLPGIPFGEPGSKDFVQYWASLQALDAGMNAYDGSVLHSVELRAGVPPEETILMWNPPWLMILMWPALRTSFETSALSWFLLQIVLLCGITAMAPVALGRTGLSLLARGAITVSFYPILECLGWGQLSIALTFTLFASLWLASLKSYFAAGVAIAPLTTKPHLFFLCAVPALMWLKDLDRSSRSRFFLGAVVSLGALAGGAEYMWPNSTSWWVESMMHPHLQPGTTSFAMWQTATITTCVRKLCELASGTVPMWPL